MPLESLLELVETLRNRISEHSMLLGQNEMRTRYALIDPPLRELGWDTSDPSKVIVEDGSGDGRADYSLLSDGRPVMIIEAKRMGLGISDGRQQAISYAMDPGRKARYFGVTDGNKWEIYDTHQPAINMLLVSFACREDAPAEVCLKATALWRPSVKAGSVHAAQPPIVGGVGNEESETAEEPSSRTNYANASQSASNRSDEDQDWVSISEFSPSKEDNVPAELRFPDGNAVPIEKWNMLITETVRWLYENGHIVESNPHVLGARRLIVSDSPYDSNGRPFAQPKTIGPLYVETHGHRWTLIRNISNVVSRTGQNPADFNVRR